MRNRWNQRDQRWIATHIHIQYQIVIPNDAFEKRD